MPPAVASRICALDLPPFDPLNRRAAELRREGHHVISLGQAVPSFPPPPVALDAARAAIDVGGTHMYVTDPGLPSLRQVLAGRLGETLGGSFSHEELVMTAGANHAFALALTTLATAGDEIVLPAPYFTNHQMMVCANSAVAVEAPVSDRDTFSVHWSDIEPHLTSRTRAIVLCNPSNPTGAPIEASAGRLILDQAAAHGLTVICDETYMHFVYEGVHWSAASTARWRDNVIVIGTFSKSFGMMGWRLGFLLAGREFCEHAIKVQDAMIICAPVISQIAGEAAVRAAWSYPGSFHTEFRERRRILADGLSRVRGVSWTPQAGGFFAFARVAGCDDSASLSERILEEAHVVTIPGAAFGTSGEGCLRLSYGYADRSQLTTALDRLQRYLGRG